MNSQKSRWNDVAERWVRGAAQVAPPALRERLEEEWLADLGARGGTLARLRFALGCHWASRVIAFERPIAALAGAGPGRLHPGPASGTQAKRRALSLFMVAGLHAVIFYACWSSLAHTHRSAPTVFEYSPLPQPARPQFRPDDSVNLKWTSNAVPLPPKELLIDRDPESPRVVTDDGTQDLGPPGVATVWDPLPPIRRVSGAPGAGFPNVDDFYPSSAVRAGEQGATTVQVCVNPRGALDAEPSTLQSSGSARLDAAALKVAKAGSGHYRPSTEDGRAVFSCFAYVLRFQIRNVR